MKIVKAVGVLCIVLLFSPFSACRSATWPQWAQQLQRELECGMTMGEVRNLPIVERNEVGMPQDPFLGQLNVTKGYSTVWLRFDEHNELKWVTLSRMDGWRLMATRLSPQRNICTGEERYQVYLAWSVELEEAKVLLDGEKVQPVGGKIIVPAGRHELRIQKPGYEPIVRQLDLGPDDRGDQSLELRDLDLVPINDE